ncbi:MAG: hypothetical protein OXT09_12470 [Myxococcales bacterium]|nr:hypothetical protein [Myxococcales bacterium]
MGRAGAPNSYDVWLVRLERRNAASVMALSKLFGVDGTAARHIVANLPRVVVVDQPSGAAEAVAADLRRIGGVVHLTRTGDAPDFDAKSVKTSGRPGGRARPVRRSKEHEAARAKRSQEDDAASLRWPDTAGAEPYAWNRFPNKSAPPVPAAVRNSAARVVAVLLAALGVLGAGGSGWWFLVGENLGSRASATWQTPDAGIVHPDEERGGSAVDDELASELAAKIDEAAWAELVDAVSNGFDEEAEPLELAGRRVGATFRVRARDTQALLKQLQVDVRDLGGSIFRVERGDRVRPDTVALVPLPDPAQVVRLLATAGERQGVSNEDVQAWIGKLHAERPFFLTGAGSGFVEGRFEVPVRDESVLSAPLYRCPGADVEVEDGEPSDDGRTEQTVATLKGLRKGELFSCTFR